MRRSLVGEGQQQVLWGPGPLMEPHHRNGSSKGGKCYGSRERNSPPLPSRMEVVGPWFVPVRRNSWLKPPFCPSDAMAYPHVSPAVSLGHRLLWSWTWRQTGRLQIVCSVRDGPKWQEQQRQRRGGMHRKYTRHQDEARATRPRPMSQVLLLQRDLGSGIHLSIDS
jgi:hypothetical protein